MYFDWRCAFPWSFVIFGTTKYFTPLPLSLSHYLQSKPHNEFANPLINPMASAFDWQSQTKHPPIRSIRSLCSSHLPCVDSFTSPIGSSKRWSNLRMPYPRFIREYLTYRFVWITLYQGDSLSHYLSLTHVSLCVIPLCGRHETRTRNPIGHHRSRMTAFHSLTFHN